MKKNIYLIVIIGIVLLGFVLYKGNAKDVKIDINKLAEGMTQNIKFKDELNETDVDTIKMLYNIDNAISQKVYISSGATAEEIAIFEFENKNDLNNALGNANKRIEEQKESFKNYVPEELKKLDNAIITKKGNYLIICITDDENAQTIIENYTK